MKLKYYMRGLGVGILLTTLLFVLSGYRKKLSDQEIIERAEKLGMVTAAKEEDPLDKVLGDMVPAKANEDGTEETTPAAETTPEAETTPGAAGGKTMEPSGESDAGKTPGSTADTEAAGGKTMEPSGESASGKTTESTADTEAAGGKTPETNGKPDAGKTTDSNGEPAEGQATGQTSEQNMKSAEGKTTNSNGESSAATKTGAQTSYSEVTITIEQGMTSDSVSKLLYKAGIVDDAKEFNNYIIKAGKSTKILIGEFTFSKNASYDDIIKKIAE